MKIKIITLLFVIIQLPIILNSQKDLDTLFFNRNWEISEDVSSKRIGIIEKQSVLSSSANKLFPVTFKKGKKIIGKGYSRSKDSIVYDYLYQKFNKNGNLSKIHLTDYIKYIDTMPLLNNKFEKLRPYLDSNYLDPNNHYNLQIDFEKNGKLKRIVVFDNDCGCTGTELRVGDFLSGDLMKVRDIKNGKPIGRDILMRSDGQIIHEKFYTNNRKRHGVWKKYDKEGEILIQRSFNNGQYDGTFLYSNSKGQLRSRRNYKMGEKHGQSEYYYKNGQLKTFRNYSNGKLHGEKISYNYQGIINYKGQYHNGEKSGEWLYYNDRGEILYRRFFDISKKDSNM